MGRAATASGRDAAMPYLNPAGYSLVPHHSISLSASLYRYENLTISDYYFGGFIDPDLGNLVGTPSATDNDLESSRFSSFPGTASMLWHFGDEDDPEATHHVISLSMIIPWNLKRVYEGSFALRFGDSTSVLRISDNSVIDFTKYMFGPGYALRLGPLRFGISAFFDYSDRLETSELTSDFTTSTGYIRQSMTSYSEGESIDFQPTIGLQWSVLKVQARRTPSG